MAKPNCASAAADEIIDHRASFSFRRSSNQPVADVAGALGCDRDVVIVQKGDTGFAGVSPSPIHGETALRLRGQGSALPRPAPFQVCRKSAECLGAGCGCRQRNKSPAPAFTTAVRSTVARFRAHLRPGRIESNGSGSVDARSPQVSWSGASTPDGQAARSRRRALTRRRGRRPRQRRPPPAVSRPRGTISGARRPLRSNPNSMRPLRSSGFASRLADECDAPDRSAPAYRTRTTWPLGTHDGSGKSYH